MNKVAILDELFYVLEDLYQEGFHDGLDVEPKESRVSEAYDKVISLFDKIKEV